MKSTLTTLLRITSCLPPTPLVLVIPFTLFYFFSVAFDIVKHYIYFLTCLLPAVRLGWDSVL